MSPRVLWKNQFGEKDDEPSFGPVELVILLAGHMQMSSVPLPGQIGSPRGPELERGWCAAGPPMW